MSDMLRTAMISPCGLYRYALARKWDGADKVARFIMLNPSTADATADDPTIRRCISFAKREGCGALVVVNLYAFRATRPEDMLGRADPVGPKNNDFLIKNIRQSTEHNGGPLIAAWGTHADPARVKEVERLVRDELVSSHLTCLGTTKDGHPRHPLYVKGDQPLIPYPWRL